MGYRSDVSIIFYARGNRNDAGENALLKLWFDENYPVQEAKDGWQASIRQKDNAIIVEYEDVKWYPSYDHVIAVGAAQAKFDETFKCDEEDTRYAWETARVGEEDNDIEIDRSDYCDGLFYVTRQIRIDMVGED
jgi:hypothetical protein